MRERISSAVLLTSRPGRDPLHQPQDDPEVLHVRPHRGGDARVLDLDRHVAAVVQPWRGRPGRSRRRRSARGRTRRTSPSAGRSSSDSITLRMSSKRTFGAASRSAPSLRWNSSRCSSGTSPTSRKLITCPSFIAAPFIVPSAVTICSAASRWRRSSAAPLPSSRAGEVGRVGPELARRLAGGEARHPRRAGDPRGRDPVLGHLGRRRRARRGVGGDGVGGRRRLLGCGGGRGRWRSASGVAVSVASASRSPSASAVVGLRRRPVGGGASASASAVSWSCWPPNTPGRALGVADRVAEDGELGRRDDAGADHRGQQAGDDRELPREARVARRAPARTRPNGSSRRAAGTLLRPVAARADAGGLLGAHRGTGARCGASRAARPS